MGSRIALSVIVVGGEVIRPEDDRDIRARISVPCCLVPILPEGVLNLVEDM